MSVLVARLLAVHGALEAALLPHAFGGAIALAYCTQEPRGTRDLDVNVFAGQARAAEVLAALPADVVVADADVATATRDGQVRVWWDDTPVDVFLDTHAFHAEAAGGVRWVPLAGHTIPVLGCAALAVFKALFDRTKDWADLEAMAEVGALDVRAAAATVARLAGDDHPAVARLAALR